MVSMTAVVTACNDAGNLEKLARALEPDIVACREGGPDCGDLIAKRMRELNVPGAGVAVIDGFEIDWARAPPRACGPPPPTWRCC